MGCREGNQHDLHVFFASEFNQDISDWNISKVKNMDRMFEASGLSSAHYDALLLGWAALPAVESNVKLGAKGLFYCAGETGRQRLMDDYGWIITDDTKACAGTHIFVITPTSDTITFNVELSDSV